MRLNIDDIDAPTDVSPGRVEFYRARLQEGVTIAPIFVRWIVATGRYRLVDGVNRLNAARLVGATEVEAEVA